ncbi:nucleotide exchange factor GrpE [Psychroflexus lacisalsi]|jgi:molecular chaperone GrpE|uniref:Protein GrpE n=1 Tax=Psychroflexus lacisalsi TaxID=503928 RepID=A0ABN1KEQ2_9FLAO|nr:nucleotide exchange factor GrpE [Psychroflexus lacisalsi]MBZ9620398.1 nucleotide exchange factor GrpE [Psychroflexus lacisalsi]
MSKENIKSDDKDPVEMESKEKQNDAQELQREDASTVENNEAEEVDNSIPEEELSKEEQLQQELDAKDDKYLRLFAEFENYKRRTSKERIELFKTASQDVMQSMLPVLDDFDRAMLEVKKSSDQSLVEGLELISNKLRETLHNKGLEVMSVKAGDVFDSELHEAITQIAAPSDDMKGKIVDVVEKGYTLGDKIIRYPKVVTGK